MTPRQVCEACWCLKHRLLGEGLDARAGELAGFLAVKYLLFCSSYLDSKRVAFSI